MNSYTKPLAAPSTQTVLPAMLEDGRVVGWYPITETAFARTELTFTLDDNVEVPLKVVTVDSNTEVIQYVAAVWPTGLANDYQPWASGQLVSVADGNFRIWNMTTQGSRVREGGGVLVEALRTGMNPYLQASEVNVNPDVNPSVTLQWKTSLPYTLLTGGCTFFDFNWMSLMMDTADTGLQPLRIEIVSNPPPFDGQTQSPLMAKVMGIPTALGNGVVYDTIRILKNADDLPPADFEFGFEVFNNQGYSTLVTLTLTIV